MVFLKLQLLRVSWALTEVEVEVEVKVEVEVEVEVKVKPAWLTN